MKLYGTEDSPSYWKYDFEGNFTTVNEFANILVDMEPRDIVIDYKGVRVMKFNFKLAIILK